MIAIETKYMGPTNYRGSRIQAVTMEPTKRRLTVDCEDALGIQENHVRAARLLIEKLGWHPADDGRRYGNWIMGASERGYVFVCDIGDGITFERKASA